MPSIAGRAAPVSSGFARRNAALIGVITASCLVFFVGLGVFPLFDYDEATYADQAAKIVLGVVSDPLTFWRYDGNGTLQPWFDKPPLGLWLQALTMALFGVGEFGVRFSSAAAGVGIAVLVYGIATRLAGRLAGLVSTAAFLTTPFFVRWAREGRLDAPVVFLMLLAFWFWLDWERKRWRRYAFWVALGLGFLVKSVVVLLIPMIIGLYLLVWDRSRLLNTIRSPHTYLGLATFAAIVLPWHAYEFWRYGERFTSTYLSQRLIARASSSAFSNSSTLYGDWHFYLWFLWQFARPWIWVVFAGLVAGVVRTWRASLWRNELFRLGFVGSAMIVAVFSLASNRLGPYMIPVVPFLAFLVGACAATLAILVKRGSLRVGLTLGLVGVTTFGLITITRDLSIPAANFLDDEKTIGLALRNRDKAVYLYRWDFVESLMFYSQKGIRQIGDIADVSDLTNAALVIPSDLAARLTLTEGTLAVDRRVEGDYLTLVEFSEPAVR
ncbi:glycosyltransferase family 39 protein [Candidatus Parcubacteria bacterium]|nr:glycosyltransferase family 39 protein [Candidatus Parcubacteria bacterium]